jgi:hemerythrin-like domain-containing protein
MVQNTIVKNMVVDQAIVEQALLEHQILQHVKDALRLTLDWEAKSVGIDRKLSSVKFTAESLTRHLQRMMEMEEAGGYMALVAEEKPNLCNKVDALKREHVEIRSMLGRIMAKLHLMPSNETAPFQSVCEDLLAFLRRLDAHDTKERQLLQDVFTQDEGGEGG